MSLFPTQMRPLPYRKPTEGRDYWVIDDALPDPMAVRERCLAKTDWEYGFPTTGEVWPGMRTMADREDRPFGEHVQLLVRHDRGDFQDGIVVRIQAGHFQIDPDQVFVVRRRDGRHALALE